MGDVLRTGDADGGAGSHDATAISRRPKSLQPQTDPVTLASHITRSEHGGAHVGVRGCSHKGGYVFVEVDAESRIRFPRSVTSTFASVGDF